MVNNEFYIIKGSSLVKLNLKDILFIEALDNQSVINATHGKFPVHFTMTVIEGLLPSEIFTRIHRSFIVNKFMIQGVDVNSLDLSVGGTSKKLPVDHSLTDPFALQKIWLQNS